MKKTMMALCLIFSSFLLLPSCKKETAATTEAVTIVGKWTQTESGKDYNQNGKPDADETHAVAWGVETVEFKADKTVDFVYNDGSSNEIATYEYVYDNKKLMLTQSGVNETVNVVDVLSLTKDDLTLGFNSNSSFGVYKR